jgi:hypothetical protein
MMKTFYILWCDFSAGCKLSWCLSWYDALLQHWSGHRQEFVFSLGGGLFLGLALFALGCYLILYNICENFHLRSLSRLFWVIFQTCGDPGISGFPEGDNIFSWIGTIKGSTATVYEGLAYKLTLKFPPDYPFKPPTVKFDTLCFHPNVDQYGNICLDILQVIFCILFFNWKICTEWSANLTLCSMEAMQLTGISLSG